MEKVNELIQFLKYSFKYKKNIHILFELFNDDIQNIIKIISIKVIDGSFFIDEIKKQKYDCEMKIQIDIFVSLYTDSMSVFKLFKLLLKNDNIKTQNFSLGKLRKFIYNFDFSSSKWERFYIQNNTI